MASLSRRLVAYAAIAAQLVALPATSTVAQTIGAPDYTTCQAQDDQAFRSAIEDITVGALTQRLKDVDYEAAVTSEWRRLGIDEILDKRVDVAVAEVRDETGWGTLIKSLADQEKAQELATAVADRVYRSDAMKAAIESLATGVGKEVGQRIELALQDSAGPAIACLKAFLGPRYGAAVADVVTGDAGSQFGVEASKGTAELTPGAVLKQSGEGITGAAILLMRRQLANMAQRIGQRLVGSILSRLVSVVAGGVGLALIAKDIWDLRHGVLPIVAEEMKSPETKDKVRKELASSLSEEIGLHVRDIGAKAADKVVEIWQGFRSAHAKALELAEQHLEFRRLLDSVKPADLPRLDELTSLVLANEGEQGVLRRVGDGTLSTAIASLDESGLLIARETRSVDTALKWRAIAGDELPAVVEHAIHRRADPEAFSRATLQKILDLGDPLAIARMASVAPSARDVLFDLDTARLRSLARSLSDQELDTLAGYLTGLAKEPRDKVLATVAEAPGRMQVLASGRVREAVLSSADQSAAVDMMLRHGGDSAAAIAGDFRLAWDGRVSPILIWERHPFVIVAGVVLGLLLLLWLRRLLFPRRPRTEPKPAQ